MPSIRFISRFAGFFGGVERYMHRTAGLLRAAGYRVDGFFSEDASNADEFRRAFDRTASADSLKSSAHDNGGPYDLTVFHKAADPALVRIMRSRGRTALFVHDHESYCPRKSYYYPVSRKNCSRTYCEAFCGCCAMLRRPAPDNTIHANFTAFAALWRELRQCDDFIVLSDFMRSVLMRQGIPPEKIVKIPPSIQIPANPSPASPLNPPHLLAIGQLIKGKGVDLLLTALKQVREPFVLDVVGTGSDEQNLKRMAAPFGSSVVFHGFTTDPDSCFQSARAVVLPWRWQEPFGLTGPEALAHGVPIIGFDTGGIREYLIDGETGLLAPSGQTDVLAAAITRLLRDAAFAAKLGANGRRLTAQKFTGEALLRGWSGLLTHGGAN